MIRNNVSSKFILHAKVSTTQNDNQATKTPSPKEKMPRLDRYPTQVANVVGTILIYSLFVMLNFLLIRKLYIHKC